MAAWVADQAKGVSAVVLDPYTGEILRRGDLSVLRRERLRGHRGGRPRPLHRPGRLGGLRARLRLQDADRHRRPGDRHRRRWPPSSTTPEPSSWTAAGPRSTTPTARRWACMRARGRHRLLAERRRRQGRPGAGADARRRLGHAPRGLAPDRASASQTGHRRRRRGGRARPRSGDHAVARDRPRQRRLRAGRRRDPDPARGRLLGHGQRRHARQPPRRPGDRRHAGRGVRPRPGHRPGAQPRS